MDDIFFFLYKAGSVDEAYDALKRLFAGAPHSVINGAVADTDQRAFKSSDAEHPGVEDGTRRGSA